MASNKIKGESMSSEEDIENARRRATIESNRRKILYAAAETEVLRRDKQLEAIGLVFMIAKKYDISEEDLTTLLDNVPYV